MNPESDNPSARVESVFHAVARGAMADLPINNPALAVEVVGCTRWEGVWIGVLITPWTLSLILLPAGISAFCRLEGDAVQNWRFPSGEYEFRGGRLAGIGPYQTCSLYSPPGEFADQETARAVGLEIMAALFRSAEDMGPAPIAHSRRAFLRGEFGGTA